MVSLKPFANDIIVRRITEFEKCSIVIILRKVNRLNI